MGRVADLDLFGPNLSGRVAGSSLNAIGLSELITDLLQQYEATALTIARNPDLLASLKAKLEHNRNTYPLFDTGRFRAQYRGGVSHNVAAPTAGPETGELCRYAVGSVARIALGRHVALTSVGA